MGNDYFLEDSFEDDVGRFRNQQGQSDPNVNKDNRSAWQVLSSGKTIGKKLNINYFLSGGVTPGSPQQVNQSSVDMLTVGAQDAAALQLCVVLGPPKLISSLVVGNVLSMTGEQDNVELTYPHVNVALGAGGPAFAGPIATIEWGIGGVSCVADVDFLNGCCINVHASFVRVSAKIEAPVNGPAAYGGPYTMQAFIGPGSPKANNASRSVNLGAIATAAYNENLVYPVPRFAKQVWVHGVANTPGGPPAPPPAVFSGYLRFWRGVTSGQNGSVLLSATYMSGVGTFSPIPVPNGAMWFDFVPDINADDITAVFDLTI